MKKLKWTNFVLLTIAGIINAVGVTIFLAPVNLFDSGMSGTAMLLNNITPEFLTLSIFLVILNFPFYIITEKNTQLPRMLSEELGRGVTIMDAQGVYSRNRKTMIYCVVNRFEINRVKRLVNEVDDSAFVTVNDISETVGGSSMRWRLNR